MSAGQNTSRLLSFFFFSSHDHTYWTNRFVVMTLLRMATRLLSQGHNIQGWCCYRMLGRSGMEAALEMRATKACGYCVCGVIHCVWMHCMVASVGPTAFDRSDASGHDMRLQRNGRFQSNPRDLIESLRGETVEWYEDVEDCWFPSQADIMMSVTWCTLAQWACIVKEAAVKRSHNLHDLPLYIRIGSIQSNHWRVQKRCTMKSFY